MNEERQDIYCLHQRAEDMLMDIADKEEKLENLKWDYEEEKTISYQDYTREQVIINRLIEVTYEQYADLLKEILKELSK
jgi:hypothetical protein